MSSDVEILEIKRRIKDLYYKIDKMNLNIKSLKSKSASLSNELCFLGFKKLSKSINQYASILRDMFLIEDQISKKNEECRYYISFYENEIRKESLSIQNNNDEENNTITEHNEKNNSKKPVLSRINNFSKPGIRVTSVISKPKSIFIKAPAQSTLRKRVILTPTTKKVNFFPDPIQKNVLPNIYVKQYDIKNTTALEALFGKERADTILTYLIMLFKFGTYEPDKIKDFLDTLTHKNNILQKKQNLIDHECRKLRNRISCIEFRSKNKKQQRRAIIDKIIQITKMTDCLVSADLVKNLTNIKQKVKKLLELRYQKRIEYAQRQRDHTKFAYATMKTISVKNRRKFLSAEEIENNHTNVPTLSLHFKDTANLNFTPATRNTRRVFKALNQNNDEIHSKQQYEQSMGSSSDLNSFSSMLGFALVAKYASRVIDYPAIRCNEPVGEKKNGLISLSEKELDNPKIVLAEIMGNYKEHTNYLHLLVFSEEDISKIDYTFTAFISTRNKLFEVFKKQFTEKLFMELIVELIQSNIVAACYLIRDFVLNGDVHDLISILLGKLLPFYVATEEIADKIPFLAVFQSFLQVSKMQNFDNTILDLLNDKIISYTEEIVSKPLTNQTRSELLTIFMIAKYDINLFSGFCVQKNSCYTTFQLFIQATYNYNTCVLSALDFFNCVRSKLDDDSILWHTCYFYQILIHELISEKIRAELLIGFLDTMTAIVANRTSATVTQLQSLNFLQFLIFNIESEALVTEKANPITISKKPSFSLSKVNLVLPKLNLENPKLQLHFSRSGDHFSTIRQINDATYRENRQRYPIYISESIHVHFLQLVFATLIDHGLHKFDPLFVDPFPHVNRKPNVLFYVMRHMESSDNSSIIHPLKQAFTLDLDIPSLDDNNNNSSEEEIKIDRRMSIGRAPSFISKSNLELQTMLDSDEKETDLFILDIIDLKEKYSEFLRLLRLLTPKLFDISMYKDGQFIASGAFGAVMLVEVENKKYAVKVLQKSRNELDNPKLYEVFSEVSILELCKGDRRVTQLVTYGCTSDSYYLVMEYYPQNLKTWRKSQENPNIKTLLRLYREFLKSLTILVDKSINHYDIKCDNVMLDLNGYPALGDFGESVRYRGNKNYTLLNKGTEWIKAPEMLLIALNTSKKNPNFDRRRQVGAGSASDVWSVGCLFYELITGEFLFADTDWSHFFNRVTNPKEILLTEDSVKLLPTDDTRYISFLEFVLQRNVERRPNIIQVTKKFDDFFPDAMEGSLPEIL